MIYLPEYLQWKIIFYKIRRHPVADIFVKYMICKYASLTSRRTSEILQSKKWIFNFTINNDDIKYIHLLDIESDVYFEFNKDTKTLFYFDCRNN